MATTPSAGSSPRRFLSGVDRIFRVFGSPLLALYLFVGALTGLRQQSTDLPADQIDCEYRAELIEERILALQTYRPQSHSFFSKQDSLTPLIEQSLATCALANSPATPRLEQLRAALLRWEKAQQDLAPSR